MSRYYPLNRTQAISSNCLIYRGVGAKRRCERLRAMKRWLGKSCIVSLSARLLYVSLKRINLKQAIRNSLKLLVYIIMQSATCLNIPEQGKAKQYTRVM